MGSRIVPEQLGIDDGDVRQPMARQLQELLDRRGFPCYLDLGYALERAANGLTEHFPGIRDNKPERATDCMSRRRGMGMRIA